MGAVLASLGQVAAAGLSIGSLVAEMRAIESRGASSSNSITNDSPDETNGQQVNSVKDDEAALCKSARAMQNDDASSSSSAQVDRSVAVASHQLNRVDVVVEKKEKQQKEKQNCATVPPTQSSIAKSATISGNSVVVSAATPQNLITTMMTQQQNEKLRVLSTANKSRVQVQQKRADDDERDNDESLQTRQRQQQSNKAPVKRKQHLLMLADDDDDDTKQIHHLHQHNINNNNNNTDDNTWSHRLSLSSSNSCESSSSSSCSATCCCCSCHSSSSVTNTNNKTKTKTNVDSLDSLFATSCHISTTTSKPNAITMNASVINNQTRKRSDIIIPDILNNNHINTSGSKHIVTKLLSQHSKAKTTHNHSSINRVAAAKGKTIERTQQSNNNHNNNNHIKQQVQQKSSIQKGNLNMPVESSSQKLSRLKSQISQKITQSNKLLMAVRAKNTTTTTTKNSKCLMNDNDQSNSMNLWLQRLHDEAMFNSINQQQKQQQLTPPMSPLLPLAAQNPLIQDSTYFHLNSATPLTPPPTSPSSTSSLINSDTIQSSPTNKQHAPHLAHLVEPPPRPWLKVSGSTCSRTKSAGKRASLGGSSDSLIMGANGQSLSPHKLRRLVAKSGRHHSIDCGITTTTLTPTTTTSNQQVLTTSQTTTTIDESFTALSYNVLSDRLVKSDRFPCSPEAALNWPYRRELILQQLLEYSPDILALQELEMEQFCDYFEPTLSSSRHAYAGLFESKSRARTMDLQMRKRVDGCAIFYKRDRFKLLGSHLLEFNQLAMANARGSEAMLNRVMTKDNIALVAVLELMKLTGDGATTAESEPELLIICNTHIYWDPEFCDVKLVQIIMLMNELKCIAQHYNQRNNSRKQPALILLGDFNSLPQSGVTNYLLEGHINSLHEDFKHFRYTKCTNSLVARSLPLTSSSPPEVAAHSSHAPPTTTLAPPVRRPALMRTVSNNAGELITNSTAAATTTTRLPAATAAANVMIDCLPTQITSNDHHLRRQSSPMVIASATSSSSSSPPPPPISTCRALPGNSSLVVNEDQIIDEDPIKYEHPFKLQSAYGMGGASMMPFTNYTTKFKATIDYIFYAHDSLEPIGLLGPLDKRWLRGNRIKGFPQLHLPSDHLPLLVKFRFTTSGSSSSSSTASTTLLPPPPQEPLVMIPKVVRLRNKRRPTSSSSGGDDGDTMSSSSSSQVSASITSGGDQLIGNTNNNNNKKKQEQQKQKENLFGTQSQREKQKLRKQQQQQSKKSSNNNNTTDEGDKQLINFNNQQQQQQQPQRPTQRRLNTTTTLNTHYDYQHANSSVGSSSLSLSSSALWAGSYASASKMAANQQRDLHNNRPPKRHQLFRSQQQHQQQRVWLKTWSGPTSSSSSSSVLIKQLSER